MECVATYAQPASHSHDVSVRAALHRCRDDPTRARLAYRLHHNDGRERVVADLLLCPDLDLAFVTDLAGDLYYCGDAGPTRFSFARRRRLVGDDYFERTWQDVTDVVKRLAGVADLAWYERAAFRAARRRACRPADVAAHLLTAAGLPGPLVDDIRRRVVPAWTAYRHGRGPWQSLGGGVWESLIEALDDKQRLV